MSLSPEVKFKSDMNYTSQTSTTYRIDFKTGQMTNELIYGLDAIKQFIQCALNTERYAYPVYTHDFGNELQAVIADSTLTEAYKQMEIPRLIDEALIYDDRIQSIDDLTIHKQEDEYKVSFTAQTVEGAIDMREVTVNV